ncbi:MAG: ABC transporter permease subunit [Desulfobacterales bacterium]
MKLNPLTIKKIRRFQSIRRGYFSLILFALMILFSLSAELFINSRALIVHYNGRYYFPTYRQMIPGKNFGLDYDYETNYRNLKEYFAQEGKSNWVLLPPVPYNAYENDLKEDAFPPFPPSLKTRHFLGTDAVGRDVLARLVYGFRIAIFFSLGLLAADYLIGISIGCAMGYFGGKFDLFFQRVIEIWSNVPFLYVIIIISSIVSPSFLMLILIMAFFGWIGMTWTMRTVTYKEKAREYVLAARALGASDFGLSSDISSPTRLLPLLSPISLFRVRRNCGFDLFGLSGTDFPPPTPSWGRTIAAGLANMSAWWIAGSVIGAMIVTLITVTYLCCPGSF